jgi:Relaxase/Mobilisation nuclease domain
VISKTTHGADFRGVLNYLLDPAKRPTIVAPYMLGRTVDELTREFDALANLRPSTRLPVRHISLSFAPEDGVIEDLDKEAIVVRVLAEMGYRDCQFIGIAHHRDDPGHDQAHHHDHLHIVVNAVNVHGERISDSHERFRIQPILREIERDFGLKQVANSWEVKREKALKTIPETDLSVLIDRSLNGCPDLQCWLERLERLDVDVRFTLRKDGAVRGITFLKDGEAVKGSELSQSWGKIDRQLATTPKDLHLMDAANVRSQEHPVRLSELERRQFERAAVMAVAALNGKTHLKTGRLEIRREGQTTPFPP